MALPLLSKGRDAGFETVTENHPAGSVALPNKIPESSIFEIAGIFDTVCEHSDDGDGSDRAVAFLELH
jgi:hypothetical protein